MLLALPGRCPTGSPLFPGGRCTWWKTILRTAQVETEKTHLTKEEESAGRQYLAFTGLGQIMADLRMAHGSQVNQRTVILASAVPQVVTAQSSGP